MSSPGVTKWRTRRDVDERIKRFGMFHPATFAAVARACIAWGGRIRPAPIPPDIPHKLYVRLANAYNLAQIRASGARFRYNRHQRRRMR